MARQSVGADLRAARAPMVRLGALIHEASSLRCGNGDYPILSMTMYDGLVLQSGKFKKRIASADVSNYKVVRTNQLVVSFPIDEGVLAVQRIVDAGIVSPAYAIWDVDLSRIEPVFLELSLRSPKSLQYYKSKLKGTTMRRRTIPKSDFLNMEIPLPPLPEQKRIAEELDRICELKKNAEARLALMDQLVKSRFVEMFGDPVANPLGWKVRKISEFAEVKIGPFGSVLHKEDYVSGGHPLVNPSHMKDGQICVDDDLTLADEKYNELEVYHLRVGDVVVARRGEIGRCALVESDGLFCGTGSMFVRVKGDCRPDYLQRVISFPTYTAKLEFGAVGVTMKNINAGMIEDSLVPLPPMTLQDSFAAFVAEVDKSKFVLRETVSQMETLYRAKLQEYFG